MYNLKYVIMACVMPHNFCIYTNDLCNPHWKLSVEELELNVRITNRQKYKRESNQNAIKIANWLWQHMNFFKKNYMFIYKLFYALLMLWIDPVIPYIFEWFFLSCEAQQTLLVTKEIYQGYESLLVNIVEQTLSKCALFTIVYYHCIRTVNS